MRDSNTINVTRRELFRATGATTLTGAVAALAGCIGDDGTGNGNGNGDGNGDEGNGDGESLDELTITLSQFPDTVDPLDHITGDYFDVYDHIYEPLFDFEPGEGIVPRERDDQSEAL